MHSISPRQLAAARALAGISQQELAELSSVSLGTIKRIETAASQNGSFDGLRVSTLKKLLEGFAQLEITFEEDNERLGVSIKQK
ncbi:helix-turn-helix domain-containing protein [Planktomarina temperata]|nr:helix-turn-helix domain-containing protein [Planktomarina temperata]